jgi:hypothetical protein
MTFFEEIDRAEDSKPNDLVFIKAKNFLDLVDIWVGTTEWFHLLSEDDREGASELLMNLQEKVESFSVRVIGEIEGTFEEEVIDFE